MQIKLAAFADEIDSNLFIQINTLKEHNVNLFELRSIDKVGVADFTASTAKTYAKILQDNGMAVWSIGSPIGKVDINIDFIEYEKKVRHIFEIAKIFNTENIRTFSFFNAYNERNKVIEKLNWLVSVAGEYGLKLFHENEKDIYGDNIERVLDIKNSVKGLNFIYDPANFIAVKESPKKTLKEIADFCGYYHIKDLIGKTDEHVPAGYGDGKIDKLLKGLKKDTVLTLEPHLMEFDAFKKIDSTTLKTKFKFESGIHSFSVAVDSLKDLIRGAGYKSQISNGVERFVK